MRQCPGTQFGSLSAGADDHVVCGGFALRYRAVREVGQRDDNFVQFTLGLLQFLFELLGDLLQRGGLFFCSGGFGLLAGLEELTDLFGVGVLLGQIGFQLGLKRLAGVVQLLDAVECGGGIHPFHGQTFEREGPVVSDLLKCQHIVWICIFPSGFFRQRSKDTNFLYLCHYGS